MLGALSNLEHWVNIFEFHFDIKIANNEYQYIGLLTVLDYDHLGCFIIRNSLIPCSFPFIQVVMFSLLSFTLPVACVWVKLVSTFFGGGISHYGVCPPAYLQHIYYYFWCFHLHLHCWFSIFVFGSVFFYVGINLGWLFWHSIWAHSYHSQRIV